MPRISATERGATRLRLIEAGKQEFAERGLAGARFDEISLAAGHAKGTIYNYFDSKESLFFTIVEEWCGLVADAACAERSLDSSARQRLLAIVAADVEVARKDPALARVVVQQMPSLLVSHHESIRNAIQPGIDELADVFVQGFRDRELESRHAPDALARLFLGALSAFELEALLPDPVVVLDDVVNLVDIHFIAGMVTT